MYCKCLLWVFLHAYFTSPSTHIWWWMLEILVHNELDSRAHHSWERHCIKSVPYLNIVSFNNSIASSITYHEFSMELQLMINLEIFTWWQITIVDYKDIILYATGRMNFSSTHQVSFACSLYISTSMCWLCVQVT